MAQAKPPDIKGGGSYASKFSTTNQDVLDDKNVILVRIRKTSDDTSISFDDSICKLALDLLSINVMNDTIGAQYLYDRGDHVVEIWLQPHRIAQSFSNDQVRQLNMNFEIISVKPALAKDVSLMILGAPLNVKDSVIASYVGQFGGKLLSSAEHCLAKSGLWKMKKSGDRRYKADFSNQILPMGTYHLIAGKKVRVVYPGNLRTCARCHQGSELCLGKGFANKCKENNGPMVLLSTHINNLKTEIQKIRANPPDQQLHHQGDEPHHDIALGDPLLLLPTQPVSNKEFPPLATSSPANQSQAGTQISPNPPVQSQASTKIPPNQQTQSEVRPSILPIHADKSIRPDGSENKTNTSTETIDDSDDFIDSESPRQRKKRLQREKKSATKASLSEVNGSFIDDGFNNVTLFSANTDFRSTFATEYARLCTSTPSRSINSSRSATETASFLMRMDKGRQRHNSTGSFFREARDQSSSKRNRSGEANDIKPLKQTRIDSFGKHNNPEVEPPDKGKDRNKHPQQHQKAEETKNGKDILIHSDKQKETPKDILDDSDKSDKMKKPEDIIKKDDNLTTQAPTTDEEHSPTTDEEPNPPESFVL